MILSIRALAPLLLLATLVADAECRAAPADLAPGFLQRPEPIAKHVTLLRQRDTYFFDPVGNITVVEQSDGLVLVDAGGLFGSGKRAIALVRAISPKPVKAIVITHWHSDHNLGLSAMVRSWPHARIIAQEATIKAMLEGRPPGVPRAPSTTFEQAKIERYRKAFAQARAEELPKAPTPQEREGLEHELAMLDIRVADVPGTYTVIPGTSFKTRLTIPDRLNPVEVLFLGRANTAGDTLLWIPRERVLAIGDIADRPIPFMFDVFPSEMLTVFNRIRALKPRVLIPGHGHPFDVGYLDRVEALVRNVQGQVTPLAKSTTLDEVKAKTHFAEADIFAGSDTYLRSYFQQYTLDPLIDSIYREARGERLGPPPVKP